MTATICNGLLVFIMICMYVCVCVNIYILLLISLQFLLLFYSLRVFHNTFSRWFFTEESGSKSSHTSRTLLNILPDLNSFAVWMIWILFLFSTFSSLISRPLGAVPRAPTTIAITLIMFHRFLNSLARSKFFFLFAFFYFYSMVHCNNEIHKMTSSIFLDN